MVDQIVSMVSRFYDDDLDLRAEPLQLGAGGVREPVGEQTSGGRQPQSRRDDGDGALHRESSSGRAAFSCAAAAREAWVGASGTWAGRPTANSLRRTGTISPSDSICSRTVSRGTPMPSTLNS